MELNSVKADKLLWVLKQEGKKSLVCEETCCPNSSLWISTLVDWRKKPRSPISESQTLSSVGHGSIEAKAHVLHVTSSIFPTFFQAQEGRSAIHGAVLPHLLRCSQQLQGSGPHSIIPWADWGESFPVLWLHLHCFSCCCMLDPTHLERQDWGKQGFCFPSHACSQWLFP